VPIRFAWLCAATVAALAASPLQNGQQRASETFRSGRDVLTIDTSVTGPGDAPMLDLKTEDFTVKVDGRARAVLTVHRFGATTSAAAGDAAVIGRFVRASDSPPGRVVVIVVDRPSIKAGSERGAIEATAALLKSLSPSDAVAAIGLPGGGVDLTRDHAAVADAIKTMTGTQPTPDWQHFMTWDEALGYEKQDKLTIATVVERECVKIKQEGVFPPPNPCPGELAQQSREMLLQGRSQGQTTLTGLADVLKRLAQLHAPKHMVVLSGGLVFDVDLLSRYRSVAQQAAESHVAMSIVHLDQDVDASDRGHFSNVFGGREYATGLGTVASMTGGAFLMGVGRAAGAFERIATSITDFYELGVESTAADADGKPHRIEVTVTRPGATVRAPAATVVPKPLTGADALAAALAEPTDVAELPLEISTYATHSVDPEKVAVIVAAQLMPPSAAVPSDWGYAIIADGKVVGGSRVHVDPGAGPPWAASAKVDIAPGRYRLRAAVVTADGRIGTLDVPMRVGLRQAGTVYATDLVVGTTAGGRLQPRARLRQDESAIGMIELSSSEPLGDTGGEVQVIRGGTTTPALRRPLRLRTREDDKGIVVAEALLDMTTLPPGPYTASAIIQKNGAPIARVSRVFEILPGIAPAPPAPAAAAPSATPPLSRTPAVDEMMRRVAEYVGHYGHDASVLIAVERYNQGAIDIGDQAALGNLQPARGSANVRAPRVLPSSSGPQTTEQKLVSEIALVQNAAAIGGWLAYRDVLEVNGKAVPDRQNRLRALFTTELPDLEAAKRIAAESARYNVGPVSRTFNVPTAALFFFDPPHVARFSFERAGSEKIDGVEAWKVNFEETRKPSMVATSAGVDIPTSGTLWIDPADGSVLRTRLVVASYRGARSRAEIEVSYRKDDALGMLVPVRMAERYLTPTATISGEATYSDFRRFQTSVSIK
jgi:VWFA-related protein